MSRNHARVSGENRRAEALRSGTVATAGRDTARATPVITGGAPELVLCGECSRRLNDCDCDGTEGWPTGWWLCEGCSAITNHLDADGERFCDACEEAYEDDSVPEADTPDGREVYARTRAGNAVSAAQRWYENAETWQREQRRVAGERLASLELPALAHDARAAISELDARVELHAGGEAIREALRLVVERTGAVARSSDAVARAMHGSGRSDA